MIHFIHYYYLILCFRPARPASPSERVVIIMYCSFKLLFILCFRPARPASPSERVVRRVRRAQLYCVGHHRRRRLQTPLIEPRVSYRNILSFSARPAVGGGWGTTLRAVPNAMCAAYATSYNNNSRYERLWRGLQRKGALAARAIALLQENGASSLG